MSSIILLYRLILTISFIRTRLMNDLGYSQLLNLNWSLKLILMSVRIIKNSFSDISTTLTKDFIASHSLSQSPQILRVDDPILITQ